MAFNIKQDDTRPRYVVPLVSDYGNTNTPINLTTATAVLFIMRLKLDTGPAKVNAAAVITDATGGEVTYTWAATDTDTVGSFDVEFQITWSDGGVETVPNDGYFDVEIIPDLGD